MTLEFDKDVAEPKPVEAERGPLRSHLQNIIDSMPSILVGVDPAGNITLWNSAAQRATAVDHQEALGRPLLEVFPELAAQRARALPSIQAGRPPTNERLVSRRDGENRYLDVMTYPLGRNGCEGLVLRVDDVTVRVRMEETMLQTEKMLSVGGLAAGMAHELNNPLGGVLQLLQNVVRRLSTELPKNMAVAAECGVDLQKVGCYLEKREIFKFFEGIRSCGMRAAAIVANLVQFCRKGDSRFGLANLAELIDRGVELAGTDYDMQKHGFRYIEIGRDYDRNLSPVTCIAEEIGQVIFHLLKNAAQSIAARQNPAAPPRIDLRTRREGDQAHIEIEDNGIGMDEKIRRRIFEPFFTTKEPGAGTGLGLSVSYFIVAEVHKGTISVESSPGTGAKFIVRLPL